MELYSDRRRVRSLLTSAEMFWMARASAEVNCFPDCRVATSAAMFNAICVRTGKSARATLIHWALHPVAISEILKTTASMIMLIEFKVMNASPCSSCGRFGFGKSRAALGRTAGATVPTWSVAPPKQNRHRPKPMAIVFTTNLYNQPWSLFAYAAFSLACATRNIVLSSK